LREKKDVSRKARKGRKEEKGIENLILSPFCHFEPILSFRAKREIQDSSLRSE
jgi:hypothetical protein